MIKCNDITGRTYVHVSLEAAFKNTHSSKRTRAHGDIWQFVCASVWVDRVKMRSIEIDSSQNQSSSNLSLVSVVKGSKKQAMRETMLKLYLLRNEKREGERKKYSMVS